LTDAGILSGALAVNEAFEWYLINLGLLLRGGDARGGDGAHARRERGDGDQHVLAMVDTQDRVTNTFITYRIA
jgi:hypothetical protein